MHNRQLIPLSQDIFHTNFCLSKCQIIHKEYKYQQNISMLRDERISEDIFIVGGKASL